MIGPGSRQGGTPTAKKFSRGGDPPPIFFKSNLTLPTHSGQCDPPTQSWVTGRSGTARLKFPINTRLTHAQKCTLLIFGRGGQWETPPPIFFKSDLPLLFPELDTGSRDRFNSFFPFSTTMTKMSEIQDVLLCLA